MDDHEHHISSYNSTTSQTKSSQVQDSYIPPRSYDALTPLYDRLIGAFMREREFKHELIRQINLQPGGRVLDMGCGTGTLLMMIASADPAAELFGIDADENVLRIARQKIQAAGLDSRLDHGMAYQLPYADTSLDQVTSSLVTHHLTLDNKRRAFKEIYRVLRPGGTVHIADFGRPRHVWARLIKPFVEDLEEAHDNLDGKLPSLLREAGFAEVQETSHFGTLFGTLTLIAAKKAA